MDALKQPFDHDAIVSPCKVVVRGDNLQPAWALPAGFESTFRGEQRDIDGARSPLMSLVASEL
jgi:hypothetical protein